MTLSLISPHLHRQLAPWSLDTLFLEPHRECTRHFFLAFSKRDPLSGPTFKQRSFHLLTSAALFFPIVSSLVYVALRFFVSRRPVQSSTNTPLTGTPNPSSPSNHPGYEERVERVIKIAQDEVDKVDASLQTDLKKFIAQIKFDILALLQAQRDPKIALMIVENAEHELRCIAEQIRGIPQGIVRTVEPVSPEASNWQRRIYPFSTWSSTFERDFRGLIEEGQSQGLLNQKFGNFFGGTLLHAIAKLDRYLPCVSLLKGTNINPALQDYWGNTGLIWACANASNGMAREILNVFERGPYLDVQCLYKNTALHLVVGKGYKDRSRDGTVLACSNLELLKIIVSLRANVNLKNKDGNTPLHLAYLRRDMDMVCVLLAAGADDSQLNGKGKRPSDLKVASYEEACEVLSATVVVFLLDRTEFERANIS